MRKGGKEVHIGRAVGIVSAAMPMFVGVVGRGAEGVFLDLWRFDQKANNGTDGGSWLWAY